MSRYVEEPKKPTLWESFLLWLRGYFPKDKMLLFLMLGLMSLSLLVVYSAVAKMAYDARTGSSILGYLANHFRTLGVAVACFFASYRLFTCRAHKVLAPWLFGLWMIVTVYALVAGSSINGAARWINLGFMTFQPSEALKVSTMILLARVFLYISERRKAYKDEIAGLSPKAQKLVPVCYDLADVKLDPVSLFRGAFMKGDAGGGYEGFLVVLPIVIACAGVLFAHTSSAAIIFGASLFVLLYGRIKWREIWWLMSLAFGAFCVYSAMGVGRSGTVWRRMSDLFGGGANVADIALSELKDSDRAVLAIYNGGFTGLGAGQSIMRAELTHPESDYIFAFFTEEWGFLVSGLVLLAYLWIFFRAIRIFNDCTEQFSCYMVLGLGSLILMQAALHVFVSVGIGLETGLVLPFISRGGSAMLCNAICIGIMMRVAKENEMRKEEARKAAEALRRESSESHEDYYGAY